MPIIYPNTRQTAKDSINTFIHHIQSETNAPDYKSLITDNYNKSLSSNNPSGIINITPPRFQKPTWGYAISQLSMFLTRHYQVA